MEPVYGSYLTVKKYLMQNAQVIEHDTVQTSYVLPQLT